METGQDDRPETPESILVVKEPVVDETTKKAAPKDEHGHYTLEFKREVVEYALRLPAAARVKPTCRAYAASGVSKVAVTLWLRDAESGATPRPRFTHSCKQCPRTGPCKQGAGCNAGSGAASQQCEHGHQRHACRRGLCPARQLNAKASYGYHTDDEIAAVLDRGPSTRPRLYHAKGHTRGSWPMGRPTGAALHHVMKRAAAPGSGMHARSSLGQ